MNYKKQHTIGRPVSYSGIALHTGVRANLTILPGAPNTGIIFRRIDLPGQPEVLAHGNQVTEMRRATTIEDGAAKVHTVEHILAALHAFAIDNAVVEMDDSEPPIADGSSLPFIELMDEAGITEQEAPRRAFIVREPVEWEENGTKIRLEPAENLRITCHVQYNESAMDDQVFALDITKESFCKELASARTFCLYREIEGLMAAGLIKGGSLDNAVVLHEGVILSKNGLRYSNEQVRHKMLDCVGDFFLLGSTLQAHIIADRPGHAANVTMVQKLLKEHPDWFVQL